jgi:CMP-N-acetylneuraminic acid synthetase
MDRVQEGVRKDGYMINGKTVLAIIPARGNSKGISDKNIKLLSRKPLISWTIEEAKKSKYIDRIIVSTDSEEIAGIAKGCGVEIPFMRPSELALDEASGADVILHALHWFEKNDIKYDFFILLQPTSPFRKSEDIDKALNELIKNTEARSLASVKIVEESPYWMKNIDNKGFLKNFLSESKQYPNRQDLPKAYILNGAIYICNWDVFVEDKSFFKQNCLPYIMDQESSLDLDTPLDWKLSEVLLTR